MTIRRHALWTLLGKRMYENVVRCEDNIKVAL
jgi:hypothetical protein